MEKTRAALLRQPVTGFLTNGAPDLSSEEVQERLSRSGIPTFFKLIDAWSVRDDAARQLSGDAMQHALGDGEDFELAFTLPADEGRRLLDTQPLGVPVSWIGVCTADAELILETAGRREPLPRIGYTHPFDTY